MQQFHHTINRFLIVPIRQTPNVDALIAHIHTEFLGAWDPYTSQAREEYLNMKRCSFKRKDVEMH